MAINCELSMCSAQEDGNDYIAFYNQKHFHQTLDYKKPMDVYKKSILLNKASVKGA
ncbi:MAG: hypothetical protein HOE45_04175 [Gammaproteobacteria bacterium]|nr:hypothetical protein [Gammaproteobacteria bacterium]MBT4146068.1 hypothetical protein [Gammaproteobacteria bacterium]MBT5223455.1 hypothetical protein [Gammaproteobacteria bacterium]MBT5826862.1 hypothetical protein [Gammaproteobacteria bacterium]MBT5966359.1 hypothetical protein [Gammaproteobacteria bacterium]